MPPDLFAETVRALPAAGFAGANVTIPHKEAALALADAATPAAREIGAANSLTFADGAIHADNTDAPGFLAALPWPPEGQTALVLGAGGSARAVIWALLRAGAREVRVWNRTAERAERVCADLGGGVPVRAAAPADLLVNCTAAGLADPAETFATLPLAPGDLGGFRCVVDLVYRGAAGQTGLLAAAAAAGAQTVDGLEILVRQGALSLSAWTGREPPLPVMRAAARA